MLTSRSQPEEASMSEISISREIDRRSIHDVRLYRVPEAMALLSLSRSVRSEQIRRGRLKSVTEGRTCLIPATAIANYIALLMREADDDTA